MGAKLLTKKHIHNTNKNLIFKNIYHANLFVNFYSHIRYLYVIL